MKIVPNESLETISLLETRTKSLHAVNSWTGRGDANFVYSIWFQEAHILSTNGLLVVCMEGMLNEVIL